MKNKLIQLFLALLMTLPVMSCSKSDDEAVDDGRYDTSIIYFNLQMPDGTRSVNLNENQISDLNAAVYNSRGKLVVNAYMKKDFSLEAALNAGERYKIYLTANAGREIVFIKESEMLQYAHSISSPENIVDAKGGALMTGFVGPISLSDGQTVNVVMKRAVAKLVVRGDFSRLNPGINLTITGIAIRNIPNEVKLFGTNKPDAASKIFSSGYDGDADDVADFSSTGAVFYMMENMQGTLQPSNTDEKQKVLDEDCPCYKLCSYLEITANYLSSDHSGILKYRFYLGKNVTTNYDIERNTTQNITVFFSGDGSIDETTWRVDIDGLNTFAKVINITPPSLDFMEIGVVKRLTANVQPSEATDKNVVWSSSSPAVAKVDKSGNVTSVSFGDCMITATAADGGGASASVPVRVAGGSVAFPSGERVMYEKEVATIPWQLLSPPSAVPTVTSSAVSVASIEEVSSAGVKVKALSSGSATLTAKLGSGVSTYKITVEPLSITFTEEAPIPLYLGFNKTVGYHITPKSAESLELEWDYDTPGDSQYYSFPNGKSSNVVRGIKQPAGTEQTYVLVARFKEHPDKSFKTTLKLFPAIVSEEPGEINILVNAFVTKLCDLPHPGVDLEHNVKFRTSPTATIKWTSSNQYSLPVDTKGRIYTSNKTTAKGDMSVTASVTGDDGVVYKHSFPVKIWEEVNVLGVTNITILGEDDYGYPLLWWNQYLDVFEPEKGPNTKTWVKLSTEFGVHDEEVVGAIGDQEQFYYTELKLGTPFDASVISSGVNYRYIISKKYWND
ncbi:MAG: Ig-like domain-containing protein [Candidatus Egerieousia sp.]